MGFAVSRCEDSLAFVEQLTSNIMTRLDDEQLTTRISKIIEEGNAYKRRTRDGRV